ncbi:hypothetical protein H9Q72_013676 [Fusarium xylarioides]|uniref:Early nodulin 75 n=1 Tax=Fusarium xylarioides TaxID=221167 RepID=A0A9P7HJL6_9HYPO|nr:hypothetical protein H9Q72_013676 [Fusarium xylarioides]
MKLSAVTLLALSSGAVSAPVAEPGREVYYHEYKPVKGWGEHGGPGKPKPYDPGCGVEKPKPHKPWENYPSQPEKPHYPPPKPHKPEPWHPKPEPHYPPKPHEPGPKPHYPPPKPHKPEPHHPPKPHKPEPYHPPPKHPKPQPQGLKYPTHGYPQPARG